MSGLESLVLTYVLNSLWQVPLLAGAAWVAARLVRPVGPSAEHRVWVGALLAEALLPGLSLLPWERLDLSWHLRATHAQTGSVTVQVGAGVGSDGFEIPALVFALVAIVYVAVTLYMAARFAWRWRRLRQMARTAKPVELSDDRDATWTRWLRRCAEERVRLLSSQQIFAPLTMGIADRCVMLPAGMVANLIPADMDTVIGHELAHVRRRDFGKNLLYEVLTLPVSYHPGVWFTRQRLTESREMVCDEMAARIAGGQVYAESLLRLARVLLEGKPLRVPFAIGVFDSSTLERRLMKLTEIKSRVGRMRLYVSIAACVAIGVAAATSAVALRIGVDQKSAADKSALSKSAPASVPASRMTANLITKITPVYPPEAKKARIQGKVILQAVIGKEGHVENLKVVSGPNELEQSAMDAVRQWVYKPYLVNGEPVDVTTKITVTYTLAK
jgi:TonB family protein